jgi:hypothetical protein
MSKSVKRTARFVADIVWFFRRGMVVIWGWKLSGQKRFLVVGIPFHIVDGQHFDEGPLPLVEFPHWRCAKSWAQGGESPEQYLEYKQRQHRVSGSELNGYLDRFKKMVTARRDGIILRKPVLRRTTGQRLLIVDGLHRVSTEYALKGPRGKFCAWVKARGA